jgi:hypothetical protein
MPDSYMHLGLLAVMVQKVTFIRYPLDVRGVAVSCRITNFHSIRLASDRGRIREWRFLMHHWRTVLPATNHGVNDRQSVTRWKNDPPALADPFGVLAHDARDHALMGEILAGCGQQKRIPLQ